jgi:hypothetical protein
MRTQFLSPVNDLVKGSGAAKVYHQLQICIMSRGKSKNHDKLIYINVVVVTARK